MHNKKLLHSPIKLTSTVIIKLKLLTLYFHNSLHVSVHHNLKKKKTKINIQNLIWKTREKRVEKDSAKLIHEKIVVKDTHVLPSSK